ncbi:MAG: chorismate mutase [Clostridiales Family XIII bacterium]|jgi:chorismate mutase/prephenate dehydratase|nr:chorismate mutase [Clostridiales Family XIII bacterium]
MPDIKEIKNYREEIDSVDESLIKLFEERMNLSKAIGKYKRTNNIAIQDSEREQEIVDKAVSLTDSELKGEVTLLMRSIMALSREYQRSLLFENISELLPAPTEAKTEGVKAVFQGAPGAWGEQAARKVFPDAELISADFFEDVFNMVKNGEADYGVVPLENSKTGAIGETYDLLRTYGCYIVGRTWIDIKHCLLAKPSAEQRDIREVFSHPEGFKQCHRYLADKSWDFIACSNTAVAAEKVAASDGNKAAAIGSRGAAKHNGLEVLAEDIMDYGNNRTSFVIISANPEYTEKSDLISITFSTAHRSGALCEALTPFMVADVNLTRIESRPTSLQKNYRFFAEISGNILDEEIKDTLKHAAGVTEYFEVIGCYSEV